MMKSTEISTRFVEFELLCYDLTMAANGCGTYVHTRSRTNTTGVGPDVVEASAVHRCRSGVTDRQNELRRCRCMGTDRCGGHVAGRATCLPKTRCGSVRPGDPR